MFDASGIWVCTNPACARNGDQVRVGLRELANGVWEIPSPRCQCDLHREMRCVSLAGNPL